ncbi:MAG TPA: oxidoreductase [Ignavibacteria bacterium]|nr:oxidoreductase [Ignavibacteria bacterium]
MKKILFLVFISLIGLSCKNETGKELTIKKIIIYPVNSSVRALEVVNDSTVWFAGSRGVFGFTENNGITWNIDSIKTGNIVPHFRSIAVTNKAVFLLSIASPVLLYKSVDKGKNWKIVYRENDSSAFYDAMAFWNDKEGIAMGDPIENSLSIIITRNGGNSWQKISNSKLPQTYKGEAAFAASNSNIALHGNNVWIVTGGKKARVFHSADKGNSWEVFDTPIIKGGQMTGIYSVDFYDDKTGIIFGGDWNKKEQNTKNKAVTTDGGKTWKLIADGKTPGYRSCVRYVPDNEDKQIIAVGTPGISLSMDGGKNWQNISNEGFYTIRFGSSYKSAWLAGNKKIGKIVWE